MNLEVYRACCSPQARHVVQWRNLIQTTPPIRNRGPFVAPATTETQNYFGNMSLSRSPSGSINRSREP